MYIEYMWISQRSKPREYLFVEGAGRLPLNFWFCPAWLPRNLLPQVFDVGAWCFEIAFFDYFPQCNVISSLKPVFIIWQQGNRHFIDFLAEQTFWKRRQDGVVDGAIWTSEQQEKPFSRHICPIQLFLSRSRRSAASWRFWFRKVASSRWTGSLLRWQWRYHSARSGTSLICVSSLLQPLFSKQRIQFKPPDPITHLRVCGNNLVLAMASNLLLRIDLQNKPDQPEEIEITKSVEDSVHNLFLGKRWDHCWLIGVGISLKRLDANIKERSLIDESHYM